MDPVFVCGVTRVEWGPVIAGSDRAHGRRDERKKARAGAGLACGAAEETGPAARPPKGA